MNNLIFEKSNFEEVKEIWLNYLWVSRVSPVDPVSAIDKNGSIDMNLMKADPVFYKCIDENNKIIGVISGFKTAEREFRSRGIWVDDNYRTRGIGSHLLKCIEKEAVKLGCNRLWSMPRKSSWSFYDKNSFQVTKEINAYEFGPHYLAEKNLENTTT